MEDVPEQTQNNTIPSGKKDPLHAIIWVVSSIIIIVAIIIILIVINHESAPIPKPAATQTMQQTNWSADRIAIPSTLSKSIRYNYSDAAIYEIDSSAYRMYYQKFISPAHTIGQITSSVIDSAISNDGIHWTADPGDRIAQTCTPYKQHIAKQSNGDILLFTSCGVWQSSNGIFFTNIGKVTVPPIQGAIGNGPLDIVQLPDGTFRAYEEVNVGTGTSPMDANYDLYSFTSPNGMTYGYEAATPLIKSCISVDSVSYKLTSSVMVEANASGGWSMYLQPVINCNGNPTPITQQANNPPIVTASSSDGLTWSIGQATDVYGAEAYFTNDIKGVQSMVFGYCYDPSQPQPKDIPSIYTKTPGCSLYVATK